MKRKHIRIIGVNTTAYILLLFISVVSFDCIESPLEPVAPTYDIKLNIPVLDKMEYYSEFTKKSSLFEFNPDDSTYFYNTSFTTDPIQIDSMSFQPESNDTTAAIGIFDIDAFILPPKNIYAPDFGIPTGNLPGLPAGTFTAGSIQFVDTNQYNYVGVNTGTLTMTVTNNLPFPISFPESIFLRNNWNPPDDTVKIAGFIVPGILNQGSSISVPSPLDNELVRGILTTDPIMIYTEGSSGQVTVQTSNGISISFQSSPLKSDSAFAVVPYQIIHPVNNETFTMDDSTVIREALFKEGSFSINIANESKLPSVFHMRINELFYSANGAPYTVDRKIQGGESYTHNVMMSALRITTPGVGIGTHLHYSVDVEVLDSKGEKRSVSKNDIMRVELRPAQSLVAQYANGRFKPTSQSVNSGFKSEFNLGKDINKVTAELYFKNMRLNLRLPASGNEIPFSYQNLTLVAKNTKHNQTRSIIISDGTIDPTQQNQSIDISHEPNIVDFTNFCGQYFPDLPDSFFVRGTFTAPTVEAFSMGNFYNIYDTSKVYPSLDLSIPTELSILNGSLTDVENDPVKDDVSQSTIRSIIDGTMNIEFTNRIPIALKFYMNFLKWDSAKASSDTTFRISPDTLIKASEVDLSGNATNPTISNIAIFLTGAEVNTIAQADSVYIKFYFNAGSRANSVKFKRDDFVHIRSSVSARCTINKP
jgi:hypothetical protein